MKITNWTEEKCQKNYEEKNDFLLKKSISNKFFDKFIAVIISLYKNVIRGGSNEIIWFNDVKLFPFPVQF